MATNARNRRLEPAYKQHAAVDDELRRRPRCRGHDRRDRTRAKSSSARIDAAAATTGVPITTVTADAGYAYGKVYGALERRGIEAVIPAKAEPIRSPVPLRRFRYDARNDIAEVPARQDPAADPAGRARPVLLLAGQDCARCALASLCLSKGRANKAVVISDDYPALLRARRRRERWSRRGQASLPTPSLALRGFPWRSEDLARAGPRRPAWPAEHAHPGLPDRRRDQPQAARGRPSRRPALGPLRARPMRRPPIGIRVSIGVRHAQRPDGRIVLRKTGFFNSPRVHFMRNALAHAGKSGRRVVAAFIATAFAQDDADSRPAQWRRVADQLRPKVPKLATLMDEAEPDVLAYMTFPPAPREAPLHQSARAAEQRDQAPHRRRRHLPQRGRHHPPGRRHPPRAERRMGRPARPLHDP